jgi:hypothetical protein
MLSSIMQDPKRMIVCGHSMFAPDRKPTFAHLFALFWLIPWVLTIPLFHVHVLDMQETPFLPLTFLTHTVFTPDLLGEYSPQPAIHQRGMPGHQHGLASHFPQYSEIAFSFFGEDDTKRKIVNLPTNSHEFSFLIPSLLESVHYAIPELASPPFLLLTFPASSRAPPFIFS